jgi:AraC-like DNA-binding protein
MTTIAGIRLLLGYAASRGVAVQALCASLRLEPADFDTPLRMVPFTLTRAIWLAVTDALPDENVGVGAGSYAHVEQIGYAGLLLGQARNGLELLQLIVDAGPLTDTALVDDPITLVRRAGCLDVRLPAVLSAAIPERTEAAFVSTLGSLRRLGLEGLRPIELRFRHGWSEKRAIAEQYFGCKVTWSAGEDVMCFEREALSVPLSGAQPRAAEEFRAFVASEVEKRNLLPFTDRVRQVVQQQVRLGNSSQQATALALGMSGRSLQRELAKSGLTFSQLRERVVEQCAAELLRDESRTIEQIARKLGYSEPRSFTRLWRRLKGETPARYRLRLRGS